MDADWNSLRARLQAVAPLGQRSRVAREIGLGVGYFHDLLKGGKANPGSDVRQLCTVYLDRLANRATPVSHAPDSSLAVSWSRLSDADRQCVAMLIDRLSEVPASQAPFQPWDGVDRRKAG